MVFPGIVSVGGSVDRRNTGYTAWTVGDYRTSAAHLPGVSGYAQSKSVAVDFRKYELSHPHGAWVEAPDAGDPPIGIGPRGGKQVSLASERYPEEGGADAAAVYGFVKGNGTLIAPQDTRPMTTEETWVRFSGTEMSDMKRYASKGTGMGPGTPGVEPEYKVYPAE